MQTRMLLEVNELGIRAFLREMRQRFASQEDMAEFLSQRSGKKIRQSTLSLWLRGGRYPDRDSRKLIREAFKVAPKRWQAILWADEIGDEDAHVPSAEKVAV